MPVVVYETTIRQQIQGRFVSNFLLARVEPVFVQHSIYLVGRGGRITGAFPNLLKCVEPITAALGARAVTGGKGHGFIEEEYFGVAACGHDGAVTAFELPQTSNPTTARILANKFALRVVKLTAAIAHERSARGRANNSSVRIDTVCERHSMSQGRLNLAFIRFGFG
jgi:hypothetical protein